jgi:hypothetical protein
MLGEEFGAWQIGEQVNGEQLYARVESVK